MADVGDAMDVESRDATVLSSEDPDRADELTETRINRPKQKKPPGDSTQKVKKRKNNKKAQRSRAPVKSACLNCRRSKVACDNVRPCKRCVRRGMQDSCIDVKHKKRGRKTGENGEELDDEDGSDESDDTPPPPKPRSAPRPKPAAAAAASASAPAVSASLPSSTASSLKPQARAGMAGMGGGLNRTGGGRSTSSGLQPASTGGGGMGLAGSKPQMRPAAWYAPQPDDDDSADESDEDAQDDDQDDDAEEPEAPPPRSGRRNSIPLLLEATAALGGGVAAAGPAEGYAGKRHPGAPYRRPSLSLAQPVLPEHEAGYDDSSPEDSSISQGRHAPHAADQMDEDIDDETLRRKALDSNPARQELDPLSVEYPAMAAPSRDRRNSLLDSRYVGSARRPSVFNPQTYPFGPFGPRVNRGASISGPSGAAPPDAALADHSLPGSPKQSDDTLSPPQNTMAALNGAAVGTQVSPPTNSHVYTFSQHGNAGGAARSLKGAAGAPSSSPSAFLMSPRPMGVVRAQAVPSGSPGLPMAGPVDLMPSPLEQLHQLQQMYQFPIITPAGVTAFAPGAQFRPLPSAGAGSSPGVVAGRLSQAGANQTPSPPATGTPPTPPKERERVPKRKAPTDVAPTTLTAAIQGMQDLSRSSPAGFTPTGLSPQVEHHVKFEEQMGGYGGHSNGSGGGVDSVRGSAPVNGVSHANMGVSSGNAPVSHATVPMMQHSTLPQSSQTMPSNHGMTTAPANHINGGTAANHINGGTATASTPASTAVPMDITLPDVRPTDIAGTTATSNGHSAGSNGLGGMGVHAPSSATSPPISPVVPGDRSISSAGSATSEFWQSTRRSGDSATWMFHSDGRMEALESEGSEDDRPDSTGAALLARIKRQRTLVPGMIEPVLRDDGSGLMVQTAPAMPMLDGIHKANSKVAAVSRLLQQSAQESKLAPLLHTASEYFSTTATLLDRYANASQMMHSEAAQNKFFWLYDLLVSQVMDFLDHIGLPHMENEALNPDGPLARFLPKAVVAVQREYLKIAKHAEMLPEGAEAASSKASPAIPASFQNKLRMEKLYYNSSAFPFAVLMCPLYPKPFEEPAWFNDKFRKMVDYDAAELSKRLSSVEGMLSHFQEPDHVTRNFYGAVENHMRTLTMHSAVLRRNGEAIMTINTCEYVYTSKGTPYLLKCFYRPVSDKWW